MNAEVIAGLDAERVGRRCLVTGAAGYLGSHLVRALRVLDVEVVALDVRPCGVEGVDERVGDVRDGVLVRDACEGVTTVFHAAAVMSFVGAGPPGTRARIFDVNVRGTQVVIDACRAAGVARLVYTSTVNVVIDRELVEVDEATPYARTFVDYYGESKAAAEARVLAADDPGGLRTVALRPGGIWGPGDGGYMIGAVLDQLAAGRFVATIGDGRAVADNTHVDSLARAELLAAARLAEAPDVVGGRAYFVTDDERLNGIAWFEPLVEGLGHRMPTVRLPGRLMYALAWAGEQAHRLGAPEPAVTRIGVLKLCRSSAFRIDRARRDLGYAPLWTRDEGLAAALDDLQAAYARRRGVSPR